MPQFMLFAHSNTASDNIERCDLKVHQTEGSKKAEFPQFIF